MCLADVHLQILFLHLCISNMNAVCDVNYKILLLFENKERNEINYEKPKKVELYLQIKSALAENKSVKV